jgi:hypothetical protein
MHILKLLLYSVITFIFFDFSLFFALLFYKPYFACAATGALELMSESFLQNCRNLGYLHFIISIALTAAVIALIIRFKKSKKPAKKK